MLELLQFRHSPYNEKVRWVLDIKQVPHRRRSLLPGPHVAVVKKLTGRTTTPVLLAEGQAIDGSARIIDWLEARYPDPPCDCLRTPPSAPKRCASRAWFDDDLTPRMRRTVLDALLRQPSYFAAVFGDGSSALKRAAYACVVPLAAPLVRKGNGITGAASVQDGLLAAQQALDFVAERTARTGYLGGAHSVALDAGGADTAGTCGAASRWPAAPSGADRPPAGAPGGRLGAPHLRAARGARRDFDGPSDAAR